MTKIETTFQNFIATNSSVSSNVFLAAIKSENRRMVRFDGLEAPHYRGFLRQGHSLHNSRNTPSAANLIVLARTSPSVRQVLDELISIGYNPDANKRDNY